MSRTHRVLAFRELTFYYEKTKLTNQINKKEFQMVVKSMKKINKNHMGDNEEWW